MQKRLFDIDWSDESKCQACYKEVGTEKHMLYHCPEWYEVRREIQEAFRKMSRRSTKVGAYQQKVSKVTLPRTALF